MQILQTTKVNMIPAPANKTSGYGHADYFSLHSSVKDMSHEFSNSKSIKISNFNNYNKKTVNDISFGGLSLSEVQKVKNSNLWKFLNNKYVNKFINMANVSQTIFDAIFAILLTCILRPAAIMAQSNDNNREKNKKAASHSISSGIIGYVFAIALFSPIKTGLNKVKSHPAVFARQAEKFLKSKKNAQTFTMLVNKSAEVMTASVRSAVTIGMIPFIDKYLLSKIFGTKQNTDVKKDLQNPVYRYSVINFKNNASKTFQNFTGGIK